MKGVTNNSGAFTLIELLVVVLIIGILAAIAVPQYKKAVEKARMSEAVLNLNALRRAVELAKLSYPGETITSDMLDVQPSDWENDDWRYILYNDILTACRKGTGFTCENKKTPIVAAVVAATEANLSEAKGCIEGNREKCLSFCNPQGQIVSNKSWGTFSLVDVGMGKICCGASDKSPQGVAVCKNFNAQ